MRNIGFAFSSLKGQSFVKVVLPTTTCLETAAVWVDVKTLKEICGLALSFTCETLSPSPVCTEEQEQHSAEFLFYAFEVSLATYLNCALGCLGPVVQN